MIPIDDDSAMAETTGNSRPSNQPSKNMPRSQDASAVPKWAVHSCPARLLAFCRFITPTLSCPPLPNPSDNEAMTSWAHNLFRTYPFGATDLSHVVVHTTLAEYKFEHAIGTEFVLQTSRNKSVDINKESGVASCHVPDDLLPILIPQYRLKALDMLGEHVYVFEFEGALSHYYNTRPRVIAVKAWYDDIALHFLEKYCK